MKRPAAGAASITTGEVEISDLAHDGRALARIDGKVTLIEDALPGERVRYRLLRRGKDVDEAVMLERLTSSPERAEPGCPHYGLCGGCAMQHLQPAAQLQFKQEQLLDALWRIGRVRPEVVAPALAGEAWGYRRRARLGVKWLPKLGLPAIGFRERRSHLLTALQTCPVLDPRLDGLLPALTALVAELSIRAQLPQIEVAAAERLALVLRVLMPPSADDLARLQQFAASHQLDIHLQPGAEDSLQALDGGAPPPLHYSPDGGPDALQFLPTDFVQVNAALSQQVVRQALDWLAPQAGQSLLELFCGLGNFSVPAARRGLRVTAIEGDARLVARARANAQRLQLSVEFLKADLFKPDPRDRWANARYDRVLLDPPRSGAAEVLPVLASRGAERIVYVSCHPATLARDVGRLVAEHGYRLHCAGVMDMFPHTAHIESMALLLRQ